MLQSKGSQRVGYDWVAEQHINTTHRAAKFLGSTDFFYMNCFNYLEVILDIFDSFISCIHKFCLKEIK